MERRPLKVEKNDPLFMLDFLQYMELIQKSYNTRTFNNWMFGRCISENLDNVCGVPLAQSLLWYISGMLMRSKSSSAYNARTTYFKGSLAQMGWACCEYEDIPQNVSAASISSTSECSATVHFCYPAHQSIVSAALVFRYRQKRKHQHGGFLCYTDDDGVGPEACLDNADEVFESVPDWNLPRFRAFAQCGAFGVSDFCESVVRE